MPIVWFIITAFRKIGISRKGKINGIQFFLALLLHFQFVNCVAFQIRLGRIVKTQPGEVTIVLIIKQQLILFCNTNACYLKL